MTSLRQPAGTGHRCSGCGRDPATVAAVGELGATAELGAGDDEPQAARTSASASFTPPTIAHRLPRDRIPESNFRPLLTAAGAGVSLTTDDRKRINLDQISRGERRDSQHDVGRLVIPEQRHPSRFDDGVVVIEPVVDDVAVSYTHLRAH